MRGFFVYKFRMWRAILLITIVLISLLEIRKGLPWHSIDNDTADYTRVAVFPSFSSTLQIRPCLADNTEDDTAYLFLPNADAQYFWKIPTDIHLFIDGNLCETGDSIGYTGGEDRHLFAIEKDGQFTDARYIEFLSADHIPSMNLNIDKSDLEEVERQRLPLTKTTAEIAVINGDNFDVLSCEFGGHGNSTWSLGQKRSYELEFKNPVGLLGMGEYNKWNLISNNMDRSQIKNRIVYEAAQNTNYEYSVKCDYVNFYINGVYQGLYLLTEKPNVRGGVVDFGDDLEAENKTLTHGSSYRSIYDDSVAAIRYYDIPKSPANVSGSYFMEFDVTFDEPDSWFKTNPTKDSFYVELKQPRFASKKEIDYIKDYFWETNSALYSEGGIDSSTGIDFRDRVDSYSWAMTYLFMDFFGYQDDTAGSMYFYKKRSDPLFYSGPIWDFDKSMTDNFYGRDFLWNERAELYLWYGRMDEFDDFHSVVVENYANELSPVMDEILESKLPVWLEDIEPSLKMDDIRYNRGEGYGINHACDVKDWLCQRKELFDSVWIRGEDSPYAGNIY